MVCFCQKSRSQLPRRVLLVAGVLLIMGAFSKSSRSWADQSAPEIRVSEVRRVFHNGEHNAFTDLVRFKDQIYLAFRSCPDGHMVHPTSSIIILRSDDGQQWQPVHRFAVDQRDTRDPHFLVLNDRLFVYSGTWYSGDSTLPRDQYDLNLHLGYAVFTDDGQAWSDPVLLEGTFGHYIWRAASHQGIAYLCGRRKPNFSVGAKDAATVESLMLASTDGLVWQARAQFQPTFGDEVAFQFDAQGSVLGVARRASEHAELLRSQPPYTQWQRSDLGHYIGGPLLVAWGERMLVGGRRNVPGAGPRTVLSWLIDDRLHDVAELPSGGDNSYPGFVQISPTQALLSWYSSHERDERGQPITAIYLAQLEIDP